MQAGLSMMMMVSTVSVKSPYGSKRICLCRQMCCYVSELKEGCLQEVPV